MTGHELAAYLHFGQWPPRPDLLFWIALALLTGGLLGGVVHRILGLPRVVGYTAAGMLVAAFGLGLNEGRLIGVERLITDLALALLLFELGSRVSLRWLRANPMLLLSSAAEAALGFGAVFYTLHFGLGYPLPQALMAAALLGASAATVIGRVATELRSAGQVTERMIVLGALNTLYAVLLLRLLISWQHLDQRGDWLQGLLQPVFVFGGSALLAGLLAFAAGWVLRRFDLRDENSALLVLSLVMMALTLARMLELSTLLVPLLAGVGLRNWSERPCIWPRHFGTAGGVLVLMLFMIVGAAWSVPALAAGALAAAAALGARALAKALVLGGTARLAGIRVRQGLALALTLAPVSATSLVLLAELRLAHPALGAQLAPLVVSAVALMALVGPVLVQLGLIVGGEHKFNKKDR